MQTRITQTNPHRGGRRHAVRSMSYLGLLPVLISKPTLDPRNRRSYGCTISCLANPYLQTRQCCSFIAILSMFWRHPILNPEIPLVRNKHRLILIFDIRIFLVQSSEHSQTLQKRRSLIDQIEGRLAHLSLPRPYILYLGTIEPRKNLMQLVESYRQLVRNGGISEHLVLAGKWGWGCEHLKEQIALPELHGKVHLSGYISQGDLPFLYGGARLFVYPSLEEGFGFPPLEAMACGTPTVASLTSALAENLKGSAELVPPTEIQAWTATIRRMLTDESLRLEKREQGLKLASRFNWERTAIQTLECYQELANGKSAI